MKNLAQHITEALNSKSDFSKLSLYDKDTDIEMSESQLQSYLSGNLDKIFKGFTIKSISLQENSSEYQVWFLMMADNSNDTIFHCTVASSKSISNGLYLNYQIKAHKYEEKYIDLFNYHDSKAKRFNGNARIDEDSIKSSDALTLDKKGYYKSYLNLAFDKFGKQISTLAKDFIKSQK